MISREHDLPAIVALFSGLIVIVSLFLPWISAGSEVLNAFRMGDVVAQFAKVALVGTMFDFIILFGGLIIVGAILMLANFDVGIYLIQVGSILTIIFTVLGLLILSMVPTVWPHAGAWLCLACGVAGAISPKLRVKKEKS